MLRHAVALSLLALTSASAVFAAEPTIEVHGQTTYIRQHKPAFRALYSGENSLGANRERDYSFTTTVFVGAKVADTELYWNPEFVQGLPFSGLHGLGGFTNGENQRGIGTELQGYRARLFGRHTFNIGGTLEEERRSEQNQVKTAYAAERVVVTAGNLSVLDVFDVMDYSRDARTQFMNWASLTYGAWDYAADARGYTWGAAIEYITPKFQARAGRFLVPVESNGLRLDWSFRKRYSDALEVEIPYKLLGKEATARCMLFENLVNAGAYQDALTLGSLSGGVPDVGLVRRDQKKRGFGMGTQVELSDSVGAYVRAGWNDGKNETFMFTEIDRSVAAGTLIKGTAWSRPGDKLGVASYLNGLSRNHRDYLAAGGLGFFLGDGRLSYGVEKILETFYSLGVGKNVAFSIGYQHIVNPGYNRDRGPANVIGLRIHAEM